MQVQVLFPAPKLDTSFDTFVYTNGCPVFLLSITEENIMGRIRNSAKALIIKDGKMAAIKIRDAGEEWYIMPGGAQEAEETLNEAVCREVSEELGIAIECKELLFVVEGVHGENFHRVDLIFSCEYIDNIPDAVLHGDTNQVGIGWLDISTLDLQPLYPSKLRRQIMNYYQGKPYKVYLGNEEAGDSECLD